MSKPQRYSGDVPPREIARFQSSQYALCLLVDKLRTTCYLSLDATPLELKPADIEWRRGMEFLQQETSIKLPEESISSVPEILELIFQADSFKDEIYFLHESASPNKGVDGHMEWFVERGVKKETKQDEQGRVNFYEVNNIINVSAGQPLAKYHPPQNGKPGLDLFGETLPAPMPREMKFKVGKGARIDEDSQTIFADVDGGLSFSAGMFSVESVYTVMRDVDFSTGNISFRGQVFIHGQVLDGFKVNAQKDILVKGMVGAAEIESGGDIIVKGGINCKEKGFIRCEGKLQAKYLNSTDAHAEGEVEITSEIVNSKINSLGSVLVPRGKIFNAVITANGDVISDTLGSPLGVKTNISAGINHKHKESIRQIDEEIDSLSRLFEKIKVKIAPIIADPAKRVSLPNEKLEVIQKLALELKLIKEEVAVLQGKRGELSALIGENTNRKIIAYGKVYPGVQLQIADCRKNIETEIKGPVKFIVDDVNRMIVIRRLAFTSPT